MLCESHFSDLVFIDESGVNINVERRYGRAVGGARVVDHAPVNTPVSTTVIAGMTATGTLVCATWQGGTNKLRLADWVHDTLIPTLKPGQIVIWDNLSAHHSKEILALFQESRIPVLYTPPYIPDMNPIEMMWSKMKEILRQLQIRVVDELEKAVHNILDHRISEKDLPVRSEKTGIRP